MSIPQKLAVQIETNENRVIRLYPGGPVKDFYGEELTKIQIAKLAIALLNMYFESSLPLDGIRNPISDMIDKILEPGVVYFILRSDGLIKIGFTTRPKQRYKKLSEKHGNIKILHEIITEIPEVLEQIIHEELKDYCVEGEWFNLPKNIIQEMMTR